VTALAAIHLFGMGIDGAAPELALSDALGETDRVPLETWLGPATAGDESVLARAVAPVLDVGCGPGRHVVALARRGLLAVGVDLSPVAARLARSRGASVIQGSVFDRVPGAGTWSSALLLDGNIGIGGDPAALLRRIAGLLSPGGTVLAELGPPGSASDAREVRLEGSGHTSDWFAWARLSVDGVDDAAVAAGLRVTDRWTAEGRWFASLRV
jgi:SAM-dependent methyltransferase